jgi:hypothetical protein
MKLLFSFSFFILSILYSQSQDFIPGYYIINPTAQFAVAIPGGLDYWYDDSGCMHQSDELMMNSGEVVIAFEYSKGKYYCFDPNGRMVVFQGVNCLTAAPKADGAGVGRMEETIELLNGSSLSEGSYYWIIGQNVANSTIKIQVAEGKTYDVPQAKISLYEINLKNIMKDQFYINVGE